MPIQGRAPVFPAALGLTVAAEAVPVLEVELPEEPVVEVGAVVRTPVEPVALVEAPRAWQIWADML